MANPFQTVPVGGSVLLVVDAGVGNPWSLDASPAPTFTLVSGADGSTLVATTTGVRDVTAPADPNASQKTLAFTLPTSVPAGAYGTATFTLSSGGVADAFSVDIVVTADASVNLVHTATPPLGEGAYPPASVTGFYTTLNRVYRYLLGVDLRPLENLIAAGSLPGAVWPDLPTFITRELIVSEEARVDADLHRTFRPTQYTRYFDGNGTHEMRLNYFPVLSVDLVQINVIPALIFKRFTAMRMTEALGEIDPTTLYDADMLYDPRNGRLVIPPRIRFNDAATIPQWDYVFIRGENNVQVTWTYGWASPADVPEDFADAVAMRVACRVLELVGLQAGEGYSEIRMANVNKLYGRNRNLPYADLLLSLQARAAKALSYYRYFGG